VIHRKTGGNAFFAVQFLHLLYKIGVCDYLEVGLASLDVDSRWDQHYELTLKLTWTLAHMQYCCGKHEASRRTADEVLNHARLLTISLGFTVR
jgi:predicted ATPase